MTWLDVLVAYRRRVVRRRLRARDRAERRLVSAYEKLVDVEERR